MAWLVNKTSGIVLTIGGTNYTSNLLNIQLTDDSIFNNGIITTSGTITLAKLPGGTSIEDYQKSIFLRGVLVTIDIVVPSGTQRHPRGYLYVVNTSYSPEDQQLSIEVGCKLYLASLSDNVAYLLNQTVFTLAEDQQDFTTLSSAIQSESKFIWQDNQGQIIKANFYDGDYLGTNKAAGEWVSVLGATAIEVAPLSAGGLVPDKIELTYQRKISTADKFPDGKIDTVTDLSTYYLTYPATIWTRKRPTNGLRGITGSGQRSVLPSGAGRTSLSCGSSPSRPTRAGGNETCTEGYESTPSKRARTATAFEKTVSYYDGPGNQLSYAISERFGPAVELNNQYFADLYAFCVWGYGSSCNPSGKCPLKGMEYVQHGYTTRTYKYGSGGELIETIQQEWVNQLACAQPADYRSGDRQEGGSVDLRPFRELSYHDLYLNRYTKTTYEYFDNGNIQFEETWVSPCSGSTDSGLSAGGIDALKNGLKSTSKRTSRTTLVASEAPDRLGSGNAESTVSEVISDIRYPLRYQQPPQESAEIVLKSQTPYPYPGTAEQAAAYANEYLLYLRRLKEGDAAGLRIIEALREDLIDGWRPGMPFRYYDPVENKIIAMRMNACSWSMDADESVVSTDGIFVGISNGTMNAFDNVETPALPEVESETAVIENRPLIQIIKVNFYFSSSLTTGNGDDGLGVKEPAPTEYVDVFQTLVCFVSGAIFGPGSLLSATSSGGVPISNGNVLTVSGATVVVADLFA